MTSFSLNRATLFLIIFLLAFFIRFFAIMNLPAEHQQPKSDAAGYDRLAISLLTTKSYSNANGLPTSYRAPLYPLFLASIYSIFGHSYFWVRFIQAILSALLCIIIYLIGEQLFDRKIGFMSSLICVIYLPFVLFSYYGGPGFLLTENLFIFLFATSILFLAKLLRKPSTLNALFSGMFLGLSTLSRPITQLFPLILVVWLAFFLRLKAKMKLKLLFIICFSFLIVISPWTIRNYLVHNRFVFLTTQSGKLFLAGNNPLAKGGWGVGYLKSLKYNQEISKEKDEVTLSRIYLKMGIEHLLANPQRIPRLLIKKILVFWHFRGDGKLNIFYLLLLPTTLLGIFLTLKKYSFGSLSLLLIIFIYFSFISMIFFGDPRFRYPIEPYMIIFSAIGLSTLFSAFNRNFKNAIDHILTMN